MSGLRDLVSFQFGSHLRRLRNALALTFFARFVASIGSIFLVFVAARIYGPAGLGAIAVAQSILLGGAIISKRGMDNALIKYVGRSDGVDDVTIYLKCALFSATRLSFFLSFLLYLARNKLELFGSQVPLADLALGMAIAIPAFTYSFLFSGFFKGISRPATACLVENGIVSLLVSLFLIFHVLFLGEPSIAYFGYAYAVSAWLIVLFSCLFLRRHCRGLNSSKQSRSEFFSLGRGSYSDFFRDSNSFFVSSVSGFMQAVVTVMLAAWMLDQKDLGLFKAAHHVAFTISFVLIVINSVFPPIFARLYYESDTFGLERLAKLSSFIAVVASLPAVVLCLVFPEFVLGFFGDEFSSASWMLRIMVLGQFINIATGSVGFLLNMTGHERLMRNLSLACNFVGLLAFYVLVDLLGALGASVAICVMVSVQNLAASYFVYRKLGFSVFPVRRF
jgi:O-antigen/teichoic acid export membrane protein